MTPTIDELRAEFPFIDAGYVGARAGLRGHKIACDYNDARARIDPENARTFTLARRRLQKVRALFPAEFDAAYAAKDNR